MVTLEFRFFVLQAIIQRTVGKLRPCHRSTFFLGESSKARALKEERGRFRLGQWEAV
jgi:hypothetical protein